MFPTLVAFAWLAAAPYAEVQSATPDDVLVRARQAYNAQQIDDAVRLAIEARAVPRLSASASVVLTRALLERHRQTGNAADAESARQVLVTVDVARLTPSEARELRLATAELLFIDDEYGAAAEIFAAALADEDRDVSSARERVFDWWASAVDRQAQLAPDAERVGRYRRLLEGAEREVLRSPGSTTAAYWLAAACRGVEDFDRAWAVAVAAWVDARRAAPGARGIQLQADLDRLMREAIIPERARLAAAPADPASVRQALAAEWEAIKLRWTR